LFFIRPNKKLKRAMATKKATIHKHLKAIVDGSGGGVYPDGIGVFLKQWPRKTDEEIVGLCNQVKQTIENNRRLAVEVMGRRQVLFFVRLDVSQIRF
jgi:hypothetical protein